MESSNIAIDLITSQNLNQKKYQFHLINEQQQMVGDFENYIINQDLSKLGKNYSIISIIGSQSSGKSTLLNYLFNTAFDVLATSKSRLQTRKGVWISKSQDFNQNFLILDIEGSDSSFHWEDRQGLENRIALFALTVSQILLINIWTNKVGRFNASQYGILKVILEMNVKLFQRDQVKQLVFVLRDFDEDQNLDIIKSQILKDLNRIWDEIPKQTLQSTSQFQELFKLDFIKLSHKKYQQEAFLNEINDFHLQLFDSKYQKYLLKDFLFHKNLPIKDIPQFIQKIWSQIITNKDLNLPQEKILIASQRCSEILKEALQQINFQELSEIKDSQKFKIKASNIYEIATKYYCLNAKDYFIEIQNQKLEELKSIIIQQMQSFHQQFIIRLKNEQISQFKEFCQQKGDNILILIQSIKQYKNDLLEQFNKQLENITLFPIQWDINSINFDFDKQLNEQCQNYLTLFLQDFLNSQEKQIQKQLKEILIQCFMSLNDKFWFIIQQQFLKIQEQECNRLKIILHGNKIIFNLLIQKMFLQKF